MPITMMDSSQVETSRADLTRLSPESILGKRKMRNSLAEPKENVKIFSKLQHDSLPTLPQDLTTNDEKVHQAKLKIVEWRVGIEQQECPDPEFVKETL